MQVPKLLRFMALGLFAAACSVPPVDFAAPVCGNGEIEVDEDCDPGEHATNACFYGELSCRVCNAACRDVPGVASYCGDLRVDPAVEACDDGNPRSWDGCKSDCTASVLTYVKATNANVGDQFGYSVAISADGTTLAVGAYGERSAATGIGGDQLNNSAPNAGAVYVFTRIGTRWKQQAYLKASNADAADYFGYSISLSADGTILAVGAHGEDSAATGVGGSQVNNSGDAGAVYVFTRNGTIWSQQAYIKASNTDPSDYFGFSVALSADGSTLAVGAVGEDSVASGINGYEYYNIYDAIGAVYVFTRNGATWSQQAYVKASNPGETDQFGYSVALSADGSTLAVGAPYEDSHATGINSFDSDAYPEAGAAYVFTRNGTVWSQQSYVKASNTYPNYYFGIRVALSGDGSTLAAGSYLEDSSATGINGPQSNHGMPQAGAAYVFIRNGTMWSQQAYVKASNTGSSDQFGYWLALSRDGSTLAVGALTEDSSGIGIGGRQDDVATNSGAVYVFTRIETTWSQQAYVKSANTGVSDYFGSVALTSDGAMLAVGAYNEAGGGTGLDGDPGDNSAPSAGAVYVFH